MSYGHISQVARNRVFSPLSVLSVTPLLIAILGGASPALAQAEQPHAAPQVEEAVVTGTRVVRDGYQAPTPVSVISTEELQKSATPDVSDYLNTLPSLANSSTPATAATRVNAATAGINSLNLRGLGAERTLVLMDGQRVGGATSAGVVDISEIPQQLISRVDVVTGGASAAYGSDALSGVVNFIMDDKFTGLKGEASGGLTDYGDDGNWKASATGGTGFANGRGHFILSGEASNENGVLINNRPWNSNPGEQFINNPSYSATNGQPLYLLLPHVGLSTATLGGVIACPAASNCGSLRGIAFGPGGTPYNVVFGSVVSDPLMSGGTWNGPAYIRDKYAASLVPSTQRQNLFSRLGYQLSDDWEVYGQAQWSHLKSFSYAAPDFFAGNLSIKSDNAYIPPSVATAVTALGISSFPFGTMNGDIPEQNYNLDRHALRFVAGVNGSFNMFGTPWKLNGYFEDSASWVSNKVFTMDTPHYMQAIDAVRAPNGSIVCRSTLTNPSDGCVPFNVFGTGVNNAAAVNYVTGNPYQIDRFVQRVVSVNVSGEPFSDWAGPVSIATGIEHREESGSGTSDPFENGTAKWFFGAGAPTVGSYAVTEGYVETVVPLAKNEWWARSLDINGAIRATGYDSGPVVTWKVGGTWSPIDDLRFRATRSRDVREPTLADLYAGAAITQNTISDPFNNNAPTSFRGVTSGNPALLPEVAESTGAGVVFQPSFFPGFNASFDYYNIDISGGIGPLTAQQIVNLCFAGNATACGLSPSSTVGGVKTYTINVAPINLSSENASGFDIEAGYQFDLQTVSPDWTGELGIRALVTHYISDQVNSGVVGAVPVQNVGNNAGFASSAAGANTAGGIPNWRYQATFSYTGDPISLDFTARGFSSGVYDNNYIQCTSGCPASTPTHATVSDNHIAGALYFDLGGTYTFGGATEIQAFFNIRNIMNKSPAPFAPGPAGTPYNSPNANVGLYDVLGRVFRVGVRFSQ